MTGAYDVPVSSHSGAEARFLSGDEGSALSAWVGAAIAMVGMLIAACAIGAAAFVYQRHRNRSVIREVKENGSKKPEAWPDPEGGGERAEPMLDKAPHGAIVPDKLSASVRVELAETLRSILEDEISRGLKASGISDRLDRLEQQAREQQVLSGSLLPHPAQRESIDKSDEALGHGGSSSLDHTVKAQAMPLSAGSYQELAATAKPEAKVLKYDVETSTDLTLGDMAALTEASSAKGVESEARSQLSLSPSARQKRYPDPPERGWEYIDKDRANRSSMTTVQRSLGERNRQTQELTRQLRETLQDCHRQKLEATYATKRLQDLLTDPSSGTEAQAKELHTSQKRIEDLSSRLADAKLQEVQWQTLAKRQRAFFMQSERVAQEGVNVFRKHPAGELFLAPPPVYLEDDMDEDTQRQAQDIGSSHINPYVNDSWPFEPNACAQRCAVEPNLGRWDEEGDLIDSDSEEGSFGSGADNGDGADPDRSQLTLRLPILPPESPSHDQDFSPPEPTDPPEDLPALESMSSARMALNSARSL